MSEIKERLKWHHQYELDHRSTSWLIALFQDSLETIEQLEAALKVCQQLILEVSHAQRNGSDWYTRADVGLYQQVSMWIGKAQTAINDTTRGER